jgi:hypothetical protein
VEIKITLSETHEMAQLSARRLLVLRHGPSARQPGVAIVALQPMVKPILNRAYNKQVVKLLQEKTLDFYVQECLSVQDVKMILHPC